MPTGSAAPPVLPLAGADFRAYRNVTLFRRGGTDVDGAADAPRFEDALEALCAFTSQAGASLQEDAQAGWDGSGAAASVVTFGIDRDDLVYAHSTTTAFTLAASGTGFGFPAGPTSSTPTGGLAPYPAGHIVKATSAWARGKFVFGTPGNYLTITPSGGGVSAFQSPSYPGAVASLPILLRHSAIGDADAARVLNCVEYWDNAANDPVLRRIRWGIDNAAKVFTTRPSAVAARVSWVHTGLMQLLGFTGDETEVASGTLRTLTATNEIAHCCPNIGLRRCHPWSEQEDDVLELRDGSFAVQHLSSRTGWEVDLLVAGPAQIDSDITHHLRDRFFPLAKRGEGLNLYRYWGDSRRALPRRAITSTQLAYDLLYTSERDGTRGRLRCVRDGSDAARRLPSYQGQPEVLALVQFVLRDRVD